MAIARQQQMIAVVDGEIGRAVEIGAAAATGLLGRLVHGNLPAAIGEPYSGREAGNSGADNVNCLLHQRKA